MRAAERIAAASRQWGHLGIGWTYTVRKRWDAGTVEQGGVATFVEVAVAYLTDRFWSKPVVGIGGASAIDRNGRVHRNAPQRAVEDAVAAALRVIGIGENVKPRELAADERELRPDERDSLLRRAHELMLQRCGGSMREADILMREIEHAKGVRFEDMTQEMLGDVVQTMESRMAAGAAT